MQTEPTTQIPLNPPLQKGEAVRQGDLMFPFRFSPSERKVFEKREPLTVSQWAERYRIVPRGAHVGPWNPLFAPYAAFIMNTWQLPHVREVTIIGTSQSAKTNIIHNCLGFSIDYAPGDTLFVMPDRLEAENMASDRIIPMIEQSPRLAQYLSPNPDDTANKKIKLKNGMIIHMAWANSASRIGSRSIRYAYMDEIEKFPGFVGKETDPLTLIRKRTKNFPDLYKIIKASTPKRDNGHIFKEGKDAQVYYERLVYCPDCLSSQIMNFDQLKWAQDKSAAEIKYGDLASYECEHCKSQWNSYKKNIAVRYKDDWIATRGKDISKPKKVAFHIPQWLLPDASLSEIATAYIIAKTDKAKNIDFYNDYLAEPFIESQQGDSLQEDDLYKRRYRFAPEGAAWQIPMPACILTAYADIQANRIETSVIAWGPKFESWIIERTMLPGDTTQPQVWQDLDRYLLKGWLHESGAKLKIITAGIDSGYLAPEVYRFVRPRQLGRRVYATKGSSTVGKALISVTDPRKKKGQDRNKVTLIMIGTETAKDTIFARLQIEAPGPGYVHFSDALDYDFFKQLCAEQCLTKYKGGRPYRIWEKKRQDARNEALDLMVGNLAVIELLNPNFEIISNHISAIKQGQKIVERKTGRRVISKGVE